MADGPKIIPDPPSAAPFPVRVNPDPPPAQPFPVPINPDPGPGGTFPVNVLPDPPPGPPHDVNVLPDGPPWAPRSVTTTPDAPPWTPVAPVVNPDPPPANPVPVVVPNDPGPWAPTAPSVTNDPLPASPHPVGTVPDPAPWAPTQVGVLPVYVPPDIRSPSQIASSFVKFEQEVSKYLLSGIGISGDITDANGGDIGSRALDPEFLANWYQSYLSAAQVTSFIAEQAILYAMNDTVARVFNPLYFAAMVVPGSFGMFNPTIDTGVGGLTNVTVAQTKDQFIILTAEAATDPDLNAFGPHAQLTDGQDFTIDEMVDNAIDGTGDGSFLTTQRGNTDGMPPFVAFDATKYFDRTGGTAADPNVPGLHGNTRVKPMVKAIAETGAINSTNSPLFMTEQRPGVVRVGFPNEDDDGATRSSSTDPSTVVDDDASRVPLSFTDLRKDPITNTWRSVYFQAFNLNFSEGFAPEYNESSAFGRVDPILNYTRTTRNVNLSWEVMAFVPEDVERMYNKLTWLSSMVYPSYTADGLMLSGPVVRLRIGDVIASESGGLPGVIRNLSFDFAEALWELRKGMKVPRSFQVSAEFLVLHDGPVGILDGTFGVLQLPGLVNQKGGDVNMAPRDNGPSTNAQVLPGRFTRFGEPVKRS